jgi:hypothetical protein
MAIASAFFYRLAAITQSIPTLHSKKSLVAIVFGHIFYSAAGLSALIYADVYDYEAVLEDIKSVI